jgi:Zn-dependent M28 family amino/carboxypeptidase
VTVTAPRERHDHADAVTDADLEAGLGELQKEAVTEADLAEHRAELKAVVTAVVEEALPVIVEDVAERLAADPFTPAAARAPAVIHTDYSPVIAEAFDAVDGD